MGELYKGPGPGKSGQHRAGPKKKNPAQTAQPNVTPQGQFNKVWEKKEKKAICGREDMPKRQNGSEENLGKIEPGKKSGQIGAEKKTRGRYFDRAG